MSTTEPTKGGGIQATAVSQLHEGDLPALAIRLLEISGGAYADMEGADAAEFKIAERLYVTCADAAMAINDALAVEPSGAPRASASVLPPPVPCSDAGRAARSVTECEKRFVEALHAHEDALDALFGKWTIECADALNDKARRFRSAARALARQILKRAEGGGNKGTEP